MQRTALEDYISRDDAIRQLSRIRYPGKRRDIDRATLSRWRNVAHVDATKFFNAEEMGRLIRVASLAFQGLSYDQIKAHLGVTPHDQPQERQRSQPQPPPASEPTGFGVWDYNPYT